MDGSLFDTFFKVMSSPVDDQLDSMQQAVPASLQHFSIGLHLLKTFLDSGFGPGTKAGCVASNTFYLM